MKGEIEIKSFKDSDKLKISVIITKQMKIRFAIAKALLWAAGKVLGNGAELVEFDKTINIDIDNDRKLL